MLLISPIFGLISVRPCLKTDDAWLYLKTFLHTRVVIHERDEVPMIDDKGINVEPNTATDIAIEHVSDK